MATNKALVRVFYNASYTDGYALVWNNAASTWTPQIQDAYRIQNRKISTTTPTDGYALVWNNSANEWRMGIGSAIRGAIAKVSETISSLAVNCPLQTNITGTKAGAAVDISAPSTGLITLTDDHIVSSTGTSISGSAPNMTLNKTGAFSTTNDVGRILTISGASTPGNNGTFTILTVPNANSVTYTNASGGAETSSFAWSHQGLFNSSIIGKCVYISASATGGGAAQNRGNFIIASQTNNSFTYYNADGILDAGGITYSINKTVTSYGCFLPFARHPITITSTTDIVIVKAQLCYTHPGTFVSGTAVQVDGRPTAFYDTANRGAADYFLALSFITSGLSAGSHMIETGLYADASYVVYKTGTHWGETTYCHFDAKSRSIVIVLPGAAA